MQREALLKAKYNFTDKKREGKEAGKETREKS